MSAKLLALIDKSLNTRITPLAYLVALHSLVFGASFVFLSWTNTVQATTLYQSGIFIGLPLWGLLTMIGAGTLIFGMLRKATSLVNTGAIVVFMAWIFATITYAQHHLWLQMVLSLITMLYFGYHFLASSLGRLWDYTP